MLETIVLCGVVYLGYSLFSSINKQKQEPESDWNKFWKLYSSIEDQERNIYTNEAFIKTYSLYKTVKIVAMTRYEEARNKLFKSILKETFIDNKKLILPVFIEDEIYYICLEKVSDVRDYDIIDVNFTSTKIDVKHVLNKMINHASSPYRVSSLTPQSLKKDLVNVTYIKDGEIRIKEFTDTNEIHLD
jgi:hypothetical protein